MPEGSVLFAITRNLVHPPFIAALLPALQPLQEAQLAALAQTPSSQAVPPHKQRWQLAINQAMYCGNPATSLVSDSKNLLAQ